MFTKTNNFNKKYCYFCKISKLKSSTALISFHAIKNEHNLTENCHEYYISKIHVLISCLIFLAGVYSLYVNFKVFNSSKNPFEMKIQIYIISGSLIGMFILLSLSSKSSIYMKYIEGTSILEEYSNFIGKELINTIEIAKIIKKAKSGLQISTINLLFLTAVIILEMFWFDSRNLFNRIGAFVGYYFMVTYFTHINLQIELLLNFLKRISLNLKENLKSKKIYQISTCYPTDLLLISRLYQASWQNFMKGFSYWKLNTLFVFGLLLINNVNFLSMLVDLFFFKQLLNIAFLREFVVLCIVSGGTYFILMFSVPSLKKIENEVKEILSAIFKNHTSKLNKIDGLNLEMIINTLDLKQPVLSFYNIFTADFGFPSAVSKKNFH